MADTIYKLMTREEWEKALAAGVYHGSAHDLRDGYIHFSTAAQISETARKYFAGMADLVLLAVDADGLGTSPLLRPHSGGGNQGGSALRWEPARDGDLFPHLYGALPTKAVRAAMAIPLGEDGTPLLPVELPL